MSKPASTAPGPINYAKAAAAAAQKSRQGSLPASSVNSSANSPIPSPSLPKTSSANGLTSTDSLPLAATAPVREAAIDNKAAGSNAAAPAFNPNGLAANFDFNSLFQSSNDSSPPSSSPVQSTFPAASTQSNASSSVPVAPVSQPDATMRRSGAVYDTTSPRSGAAHLPGAGLPGSRPFSGQSYNQNGGHHHSNSASNIYPYTNARGTPNQYRGPPSAGPNGKFQQGNPASPRLVNGNLPQTFPHWSAAGQYPPYYYGGGFQPYMYGPQPTSSMAPLGIPPSQSASLSPSLSSASLARTASSSGPAQQMTSQAASKTPSPSMQSAVLAAPTQYTPSPAQTTISTIVSPPPSIASAVTSPSPTPFKPNVAAFNPAAHEFAPVAGFKPVPRKNAAIQIRRPPVAAEKKADVPKAEPVKIDTIAADKAKEEADKKAADLQAADVARQAAEAKAASEAKAQAEEEAKAKSQAEEEARQADARRIATEAQEKADREAKAEADKEAREQAEKKENEERLQAESEKASLAKAEADRLASQLQAETTAGLEAKPTAQEEQQSSDVTEQEATEIQTESAAQASATIDESVVPSDTASETIDAAAAGDAPTDSKRKVIAPLDLSATKPNESSEEGPSTPGAALKSAHPISNLSSVSYPASIQSPRPELNADSEPGKYRYDRDFLLQFMNICRERPEQLPSLEAIGMAEVDGSSYTPAGGQTSGTQNGRRPSGPVSTRGGMAGQMPRGMTPFSMGNFGMQPAGPAKTSEQRFQQSLGQAPFSGPGGRPAQSGRQMSMGGLPMGNNMSARSRSDRGKRRADARSSNYGTPPMSQAESFTSLQTTENAWAPGVQSAASKQPVDPTAPEVVVRKVKALLNKLTMEKFESISNQILDWANKSEQETDGRILRQVIALIFEKATDEAAWSEMYALLCRKLQEKVSPNVVDLSLKLPDGAGVSGGQLFRKYLLNRCQEDYEKGWSEKMKAAAAATAKATEDKAKQEANEKSAQDAQQTESEPKEAELLSDEYYVAQKAKRRGLGLVRFIGELYKLSMLTARIMHECIKKLLHNTDDPEEDDMESLCRLLMTVGKQLEADSIGKQSDPKNQNKSKGIMTVYFDRLTLIMQGDKISSRIRFMVLDVIDCRKDGWTSRTQPSGPKTIAQIHKDARIEEAEQKRVASSGGRLPHMSDQFSRQHSRRGQSRDQNIGPDGWSIAGPSAPAPVVRSSAGDLSAFGKVRGSSTGSDRALGVPSTAFTRGKNLVAKPKEAAEPSRQNAFAALANPEASQEPPTDGERPKLALLKRTIPSDQTGEDEAETSDAADDEEGEEKSTEMDEATVKRSIASAVPEFFANKNVEEGIDSFRELPAGSRQDLVKVLAEEVIHKKEADVQLVADLFATLSETDLVTAATFEIGLAGLVETLDDTTADVPRAFTYCGRLLANAGLSEEQVQKLSESMEAEELEIAQDRLIQAFRANQQ